MVRGKAKPLGEAAAIEAARVSEEDMRSAEAAWKRDAPPSFRALVEARRYDTRKYPTH